MESTKKTVMDYVLEAGCRPAWGSPMGLVGIMPDGRELNFPGPLSTKSWRVECEAQVKAARC